MKKNILRIIVGTVCIEAILTIIFILTGNMDDVLWNSLMCAGLIILYCIPCLIHANIYEKSKIFAIFGIVLSIFSCIFSITTLVFDMDVNTAIQIIIMETWFWAYYSIVMDVDSNEKIIKYFKYGTIISTIGINMYRIIETITEEHPEGFFIRLYLVLVVLTLAGTVCLAILSRIHNKKND